MRHTRLVWGVLALGVAWIAVGCAAEKERKATMLTRTYLLKIEQALEMYRLDRGAYPSTEEGLEVLVREPASAGAGDPAGGYLREVPSDAWGAPFQYARPGRHNPDGFDLWSLAADGAPGGEGAAADLGNW